MQLAGIQTIILAKLANLDGSCSIQNVLKHAQMDTITTLPIDHVKFVLSSAQGALDLTVILNAKDAKTCSLSLTMDAMQSVLMDIGVIGQTSTAKVSFSIFKY